MNPSGCSTAAPAALASPNARARPCSARNWGRTRPSPCSATSPTATACGPPPDSSAWPPTPWSDTAASPAATPGASTTSSWPFPPRTDEVQFDEKWSFVFKKQEHGDPDNPADANHGDWWDHIAYDPE